MGTVLDYLLSNDYFSTIIINRLLVKKEKENEKSDFKSKTCIIMKEYDAIIDKHYKSGNPKIEIKVGFYLEKNVPIMITLLRFNDTKKYTYITATNPAGEDLTMLEELNKDETLPIVIYNQKMEYKVEDILNPYRGKLTDFISFSKSSSWTSEEFIKLRDFLMEKCENDASVMYDILENMEEELNGKR